jgi:hypothetical protein
MIQIIGEKYVRSSFRRYSELNACCETQVFSDVGYVGWFLNSWKVQYHIQLMQFPINV